jgi:pimeloyl-ACP methyl ester carboxylesterase
MHYVDVGSGDPIVFLHGNPEWSYSWRNVIPHLEPLGRCIAPDLIGFGRSDKPEIEYRWVDRVRYVETFIEKMGLRNMIMVIHDQGSGLGFHYAMRNQDNVRGLAFFEAIIRPYPWNQFSTPRFSRNLPKVPHRRRRRRRLADDRRPECVHRTATPASRRAASHGNGDELLPGTLHGSHQPDSDLAISS